jgi:hypothetical protein
MAAKGSVEDSFTFVGGINTEGGFLLTPKNSWKEGDNVTPQTNGTIVRRRGVDLEATYDQLVPSPSAQSTLYNYAYFVTKWETVGGNGNTDFFVVQIGSTIYFYDAIGGTVSLRRKAFSIDLLTYQATGNTDIVGSHAIETTGCYGNLVITSQSTDPIVVTYNSIADTVSVKRLSLLIRDFTGLYMGTPVTEERTAALWTTLYPAAIYNLYNQGWNADQITAYSAAYASKLPANTKSWVFGKDASDNFVATTLNKQEFGTSPAPKGRFVLDAFNQDRATVAAISGITAVVATISGYQDSRNITGNPVGSTSADIYTNYNTYRPRSCAFFAGRAWYAGVKEGTQSTWVMFSSVATDTSKLEICHQANDPTAEVLSDLTDDDGGVLTIPEAGEIVALRAAGAALLVFATNGVWSVIGGQDGFKATAYIVDRLSAVGCLANKSITQIEDLYLYWSITGIYAVKVDQAGLGTVQNISDANIKTLYSSIPVVNKLFVQGAYNTTTKVVTWLYSSGILATETDAKRYFKDKALCFDTKLASWYTYTLYADNTSPVVVSLALTTEALDTTQEIAVAVGADLVLSGADAVVVDQTVVSGGLPSLKLATLVPSGTDYTFTFSDFLNARTDTTAFTDWYSASGTNEPASYLVTGYYMSDVGPARSKTGGYIHVLMNRTEVLLDGAEQADNQSGIQMQTRWDFTDNTGANKWSSTQQVYRQLRPMFLNGPTTIEDGYPLVITKNKLRGRGKAMQLKFSSDVGKDMQIVGWTMTFLGNTNV